MILSAGLAPFLKNCSPVIGSNNSDYKVSFLHVEICAYIFSVEMGAVICLWKAETCIFWNSGSSTSLGSLALRQVHSLLEPNVDFNRNLCDQTRWQCG